MERMMDLEALEAQIQADPDMMFASGYVLQLVEAIRNAERERDEWFQHALLVMSQNP